MSIWTVSSPLPCLITGISYHSPCHDTCIPPTYTQMSVVACIPNSVANAGIESAVHISFRLFLRESSALNDDTSGDCRLRCDPLGEPPADEAGCDRPRNIVANGICSVGPLRSLPLSRIGEMGLNGPCDRGEEGIDRSVGDEGPDWLVGEGENGGE